MGIFSLKIRIALLWVFIPIAVLTSWVLRLRQEELVVKTMGEAFIERAFSIFPFVFILIPLVMAILSVSLKDVGNRRTNIILGIIFILLNIGYLSLNSLVLSVPIIILAISIVVAAVLVFVYALRWPRYE